MAVFTSGMALFLLLWTALAMNQRHRLSVIEGLHGTVHWASRQKIMHSELLPQSGTTSQGVYVEGWLDGKTGDTLYLRHNGPEHVLAFAPTRSGKSVGLVIPTLLSWPGSLVCYDIKSEN
ncbi:MAG: type IV secretory system conjugative DNA transfer family protein [Herbaspirillum sp.]|nr:type IV secretory system conjugative DNA transfer family protein [Herbaspirillum sp.]